MEEQLRRVKAESEEQLTAAQMAQRRSSMEPSMTCKLSSQQGARKEGEGGTYGALAGKLHGE